MPYSDRARPRRFDCHHCDDNGCELCGRCPACDGRSTERDPCRTCGHGMEAWMRSEAEHAYMAGVDAYHAGEPADRDPGDELDRHWLCGFAHAMTDHDPAPVGFDRARLSQVMPDAAGPPALVSGWLSSDGQAYLPVDPPLQESEALSLFLGEAATAADVVFCFAGWWVLAGTEGADIVGGTDGR